MTLRRHSVRVLIGTLLVAAVAMVAPASGQAAVTTVRATAAYEFFPAASGNKLIWTQRATTDTPSSQNKVFAKIDGGPAFRVNPVGTHAVSGGMDGDLAIYESVSNATGQSNLRIFDVVTRQFRSVPAGVNTTLREFHPTMSGRWILFGRVVGQERRVLLFDKTTSNTYVLDRGGTGTEPGQVNGNFADWVTCLVSCNVHRVDLTSGAPGAVKEFPLPHDRLRASPSVGTDGTVYFVSRGETCGSTTTLNQITPDDTETTIASFGSGVDSRHTYVDGDQLYFDRHRCGGDSNIYKVSGVPVS